MLRARMLLAGAVLLAGCATAEPAIQAPPPPDGPDAAPAPPPALVGRATYLCDDGVRMEAVFEEAPAQVRLTFTDTTVLILPQAPAASGFRFSDGPNTLTGKGVEARWEAEGRPPAICTDITEVK